jgi:hypothetical protein
MFLHGLLGSSRRLFPLRYLVFQSSFLMKDFKCINLFACKLDLHMQMQLQTQRLMKSDLPTLSHMTAKKFPPVLLMNLTMMMILLICIFCLMRMKNCKGITREVTYLGPQYSGEILQNKVWTRNGHNFLVDGALLSSMDAPDISTFPVSIEQYATEIPKSTQEQIQSISHPKILDNDQ